MYLPTNEAVTSEDAEDSPQPQLSCELQKNASSDDFFLSPGQTLTGIDLIRMEGSGLQHHPVPIDIIDAYIDPKCISQESLPSPANCHETLSLHGTSVSNILLAKGNGAFALSKGNGSVKFHDFLATQQTITSTTLPSAHSSPNKERIQIELASSLLITDSILKSPSSLIQFSGYLGLIKSDLKNPSPQDLSDLKKINEIIFAQFHELARRKTLVIAAGNNDSFSSEINNFASQNMFIAGALDGSERTETVNADKITAYVPSGNFGANGRFNAEKAGTYQTSGAAPVMSGAIANVKALLPQISNSDLKTLIKKTGIPTAFDAPMLNAYKMFRVAKEITKKCSIKSSKTCIAVALEDNNLFNFDKEAASEAEKLKLLLKSKPAQQCLSKEEFALARKIYLLQPNSVRRSEFEALAKYTPNLKYP